MTTSSEFVLPSSDTRYDDDASGDSTLDPPRRPDLSALCPDRNLDSTIDGTTGNRQKSDTPSTNRDRIFGGFEIESQLGQGAMGEVYRATQTGLGRTVALKILPRELAQDVTLVERFHREAQALAVLDHPHIVRLFQIGEERGVHFAAMEFIGGDTLQGWLDRTRVLPVGDALHIALVSAAALGHAHDRGIIHRDVKPTNVLVSRDGVVKLADFGLVRLVKADLSMTGSGTGLGTPEYMAPEQSYDARNASPHSDIFSLGTMLYAMLTGELPYKATSIVEYLSVKQAGVFKPAKLLNPEVPQRLDLILQKMLAPEPNQRYSNCATLIHDLAALGRHNDSLSFLDAGGSQHFVAYGPWMTTAARRAYGVEARSETPDGTASTDAASASGATLASSAQPTGSPGESADTGRIDSGGARQWYVAHKNKLGKSVLSKMMTDDLIRALEYRLLPVNAQVKTSPSERFRPLMDFEDFHPVLLRLKVRIRRPDPKSTSVTSKSAGPGTGRKRRRKKRSEQLDLVLRVVVGLAAMYGLIRGLVDIGSLMRGSGEPPTQTGSVR